MVSEPEYDFDDAWDDLGSPRRVAGAGDAFIAAYARVLVRLPADVREFALERCIVFAVGRAAGARTWPVSIVDKRRKKWIIVVDENLEERDVEYGIAHEIAHARVGHNVLDPDLSPDNEVEADALAVAWGFSKSYPNAPQQQKERGRVALTLVSVGALLLGALAVLAATRLRRARVAR